MTTKPQNDVLLEVSPSEIHKAKRPRDCTMCYECIEVGEDYARMVENPVAVCMRHVKVKRFADVPVHGHIYRNDGRTAVGLLSGETMTNKPQNERCGEPRYDGTPCRRWRMIGRQKCAFHESGASTL